MAAAVQTVSKGRIEFRKALKRTEIDLLVSDKELEVLQTSEPVDSATWEMLNDRLFSVRADVTLRVYGYSSSEYDLSFLPLLKNLRRFSADCLMRAKCMESLAALRNLKSLAIGIYNLESFEFLDGLAAGHLRELSLQPTKSKKPTLRHLERFQNLRRLNLYGQKKEIEVIANLGRLEELTLGSMTVRDVGFLQNLKELWSVDIIGGGTSNLDALAGMGGIKLLELRRVRGLKELSVISYMHGLQCLILDGLSQIKSLPDMSNLKALRRVYLENMKGLSDLSRLLDLPVLEEFIHVCALGMEPEQYRDVLQSRTLRAILVGFGSSRKNQILSDMASQAGIKEYAGGEFRVR